MQTVSEQKKLARKRAYDQYYRDTHNFMDCPGDTNMPMYSAEEIHDIEEGKLKHREIAEKYGRSYAGVMSKKTRMSDGYKTSAQKQREEHGKILKLKVEGNWDFINNRPKANVKVTKAIMTASKAKELNSAIDELINGSLSIEDFLNL